MFKYFAQSSNRQLILKVFIEHRKTFVEIIFQQALNCTFTTDLQIHLPLSRQFMIKRGSFEWSIRLKILQNCQIKSKWGGIQKYPYVALQKCFILQVVGLDKL